MLFCPGTSVSYCTYVNSFCLGGFGIDFFLHGYNCHWSRRPQMIFRSKGNIPWMERLKNDVHSSTSPTRLSTISNQASPQRSSMRTKRGTTPSTDMTFRLAVRSGDDLIVFLDSIHAVCRKSVVSKLLLAPVSNRLYTVSMAFKEIPTDIWTQQFVLQKYDATSYGPSYHCTLMANGPFAGSVYRCSRADASILSVVSMFGYVLVMLS